MKTAYPCRKTSFLFIFNALINTASGTASAAQNPSYEHRYIALVSENDNYVPPRDDRHYTNGFRLSYGFAQSRVSKWRNWLGKFSTLEEPGTPREYNVAIGQNIYTPASFAFSGPIKNDRPFAAWLYGELAVTSHSNGIEEEIAVNVGVVGPLALGEQSQKLIHTISGDTKPRGWSNQLDNEPALLLHYRRSWFEPLYQSNAFNIDLVPKIAVNLGNVVSEAGMGTTLRLGSFLAERDQPANLLPGMSTASPRFEVRHNRFDWMIFGSLTGRGVAHNIFLDGNTYQASLSVDKNHLVWDASIGLMFILGQFKKPVAVSFTHLWRSKEFRQQQDIDKFGSVRLSIQY